MGEPELPSGLTAGGVTAGIDQQRGWQPKKDDIDVAVDMQLPEMQGSDVRIGVKALHFTGLEDAVDEQALQDVVAPSLQDEMTINDLWKIATLVTNYLHAEGFMSAIAVLPEQEIVDGNVTMQVLLGHYDRAAFENTSKLRTSRAVSFLPGARPGKMILRGPLDRELLILNDLPGVKAHAYLSPGRETGTADILFRLETTEVEGGATYVENFGSRYTGRWRFGGFYYRNNLAHMATSSRSARCAATRTTSAATASATNSPWEMPARSSASKVSRPTTCSASSIASSTWMACRMAGASTRARR